MSNKKLGDEFENELCEKLFRGGFWVHMLVANQHGQPADIIACKNRKATLIDCKVCSSNTFPLSRIEENQILSMERWRECGNGDGLFAIKMNERIFMVTLSDLMKLIHKGRKVLKWEELCCTSVDFERWLTWQR